MKFDFSDKTVIVTGAAGIIGSEIAKEFIAAGANVLAADIREDALFAMAGKLGPKAAAYAADLRISGHAAAMVAEAVKRFGRVDALVNAISAAGRLSSARMEICDYDEELWHDIIATNMTAPFYCEKAAAAQMMKQGEGGSIVNIGTDKGLFPAKLQCAFSAAEAGLFNFTKATGMEMAPDGIRINAVAVGEVSSCELSDAMQKQPEEAAKLMSHIPAGRLAEPRDFSALVCFLCSDEAGYMNGAVIPVDGAWTVSYARDF